MWGAATNTSYDSMPTTLGIVWTHTKLESETGPNPSNLYGGFSSIEDSIKKSHTIFKLEQNVREKVYSYLEKRNHKSLHVQ